MAKLRTNYDDDDVNAAAAVKGLRKLVKGALVEKRKAYGQNTLARMARKSSLRAIFQMKK